MKVKAKHGVNYNGTWHQVGEVFAIDDADAAEMQQYAEVADEQPAAEIDPTAERTEPARRTRARKPKE